MKQFSVLQTGSGATSTGRLLLVSRIKDELLLGALHSSDLEGLVQVVISFVRDALPLAERSPNLLSTHRARLHHACACVFYDTVAGDLPNPVKPDPEPGDAVFRKTILELASGLAGSHQARGYRDGLSESAPILAEAAGLLSRQRWSELLAREIQRLESPETPPAASFLANGRIVWSNSALRRLIHARQIEAERVLQTMTGYAREVALAHAKAALDALPERKLEERRMYLFGDVRTEGLIGDLTVVVRASEVRRNLELTDRELQVARMVAAGKSYRETADKLGIAIDTARSHVRRVYRKLGVHDRIGLHARMKHDGLMS